MPTFLCLCFRLQYSWIWSKTSNHLISASSRKTFLLLLSMPWKGLFQACLACFLRNNFKYLLRLCGNLCPDCWYLPWWLGMLQFAIFMLTVSFYHFSLRIERYKCGEECWLLPKSVNYRSLCPYQQIQKYVSRFF